MMMVYQLKVGACLIAFYLLFKWLLSHDTLHRFNRVLLLVLVALSVVLPWVQLPVAQSASVVSGFVGIKQILVQSEAATATPGHPESSARLTIAIMRVRLSVMSRPTSGCVILMIWC